MSRLRLGVELSPDDAHALVATLIAADDDEAIRAPALIAGAVEHVETIELTPVEQDAILAVLEDPPAGPLADLRGVLLVEHRARE